MAQPANSFSSYDAIGNREDLINQIYMVEQERTPFTSRIAKITATATNHEWQTDDLAAAVDTNAVIEGDDATPAGTGASRCPDQGDPLARGEPSSQEQSRGYPGDCGARDEPAGR